MIGKIKTPPPTVTIENPSDGTMVQPPVTVSGTATDDVAVTSVKLLVVDPIGRKSMLPTTCTGCGTPSASWTITLAAALTLLPGPYDLTAYAFDGNGSATAHTISVFVSPVLLQ